MITITNEEKFEQWLIDQNWGMDLYTFEKFSESTQKNIYATYKAENNE